MFKEIKNNILKRVGIIPNVKDFKGILYEVNDKMIHEYGYMLAATFPFRKDGVPIIVDKDFEELCNGDKEFILKHELGHIELKHVEQVKNEILLYGKEDLEAYLEREKEADQYAFDHMENPMEAIKGLETVYNYVKAFDKDIIDPLAIEFLEKRLESLKENILKLI